MLHIKSNCHCQCHCNLESSADESSEVFLLLFAPLDFIRCCSVLWCIQFVTSPSFNFLFNVIRVVPDPLKTAIAKLEGVGQLKLQVVSKHVSENKVMLSTENKDVLFLGTFTPLEF